MSNSKKDCSTARNAVYAAIGVIGITTISSYVAFKYFEKNYPSFPKLKGKYEYIGVSYHRVDNGIPFKIYYPSSKEAIIKNKCKRPYQYFKNGDKCIDGLNIFHSRTIPKWLYPSLNIPTINKWSKIPCFENAPIQNTSTNKKYPILLFSHGIRSNWDQYTNLCCSLASYGYIVIIMEHNDGSAFYTKTKDDQDIFYIRSFIIDDKTKKKYNPRPWKREHYIQFRGNQINKYRIPQYINLFKYILNINGMKDKFLQNILNHCDLNNIIFGGHSFGAATATMSAIKIENEYDEKIRNCVKGVLCLDPWFLCLSDDELTANKWNLPVLMLISDEYYNDEEKLNAMKLILNENNCNYKVIENLNSLTHIDFCDIAFWGPSILTKTSQKYSKQELIDFLTNTCLFFIKKAISNK